MIRAELSIAGVTFWCGTMPEKLTKNTWSLPSTKAGYATTLGEASRVRRGLRQRREELTIKRLRGLRKVFFEPREVGRPRYRRGAEHRGRCRKMGRVRARDEDKAATIRKGGELRTLRFRKLRNLRQNQRRACERSQGPGSDNLNLAVRLEEKKQRSAKSRQKARGIMIPRIR